MQYEWDFISAEREYQRAIALKPVYATAHFWYAINLMNVGRFDEAVTEMQRALELDPISYVILANAGRLSWYAGQPDAAVEYESRALSLEPNRPGARYVRASVYEAQGRTAEATGEFLQWITAEGADTDEIAAFERAYRESGMSGFWETRVQQLEARQQAGVFVSPRDLALAHAQLGEADEAVDWLERAYAQRGAGIMYLKVSPEWRGLRSHPRFQDLLDRIGFPP